MAASPVGEEPPRPISPLSTRVTRTPYIAASMAAMQAAVPPPTTRTSVLSGIRLASDAAEILADKDPDRAVGTRKLTQKAIYAAFADEARLLGIGVQLEDVDATIEYAPAAAVAEIRIDFGRHGQPLLLGCTPKKGRPRGRTRR